MRGSEGMTSPAPSPLNPREREILKDIIRTYSLTGEPVSSRTLSKHERHGLSAASIRNVMADLEEEGYLSQPHTSAGRIPTQAAYRLYVQVLMEARNVPEDQRRYILDAIRRAETTQDLMQIVSRLLSELSNQVGVVVIPNVDETTIRAIEFLPLGDRRVLCVVVSSTGFVDNVVIELEEESPREELVRISNYLTDHFSGRTLREIRDFLVDRMAEERELVDRSLSQTIELARSAVRTSARTSVLVEGTTSLLGQPELADLERIRRMLDAFGDKARLVTILNRCLSSDSVRIFLGEDTDLTQELDFSVVATSYGVGERTLGSLGIIGPSRMEYAKAVALVRFLGQALSRALTMETRR